MVSVAVLGIGVLCSGGLLVPRLADGGVEAGNVFPKERRDSLAHEDGRHIGDAVAGAQPCLLLGSFAVAVLVGGIGVGVARVVVVVMRVRVH